MKSDDRPNLLVYGVNHSGTSILTRMLFSLGWTAGVEPDRLDVHYAEPIRIRECNAFALENGRLPDDAGAELAALETPWAIKDPRFVLTLPLWEPLFEASGAPWPVLVWIHRDPRSVEESFRRRGEKAVGQPGTFGRTVAELRLEARRNFDGWRGPRVRLAYEDLALAVALFVPEAGKADPAGEAAGAADQVRAYVEINRRQSETIFELRRQLEERRQRLSAARERLERYRSSAESRVAAIDKLRQALAERDATIARLRGKRPPRPKEEEESAGT